MLRIWPLVGATTLLAVLALACNGDGAGTPSTQDETQPTEQTPAASPSLEPTPMTYAERPELTIDPDKKYTAIIETEKGTFRIQLRPDLAIQTVNSFVFLAREGYYDGVTFHRVLRERPGQPDFVAQGGDPTGTGSGGPGYNLPDEFSDTPFERGTVAMANTGAPNSGGSQFFITYNDQFQDVLNERFTVFGKVIEGMEVIESLTPRDPDTDPNAPPGDAIISIKIEVA
jgi:peptidylprolyl isomerase